MCKLVPLYHDPDGRQASLKSYSTYGFGNVAHAGHSMGALQVYVQIPMQTLQHSGGHAFRVHMPCIITFNAACFPSQLALQNLSAVAFSGITKELRHDQQRQSTCMPARCLQTVYRTQAVGKRILRRGTLPVATRVAANIETNCSCASMCKQAQ